jgi:hypothetical protein
MSIPRRRSELRHWRPDADTNADRDAHADTHSDANSDTLP